MVEKKTLEEDLGKMEEGEAEPWVPPPTPLPNFSNISLVVPKKTNARRREWIASRIKLLMGAYRWDDFTNPALFVSGVEMMLEQYPDCVIENITSPRCGLQTESVRPPGQAEIRARCDNSLRSYRNIALNNARKARAAEEAKALKPPPPPGPKVDLMATHPYFSREAVERRHCDPFDALKKLAKAAGRTLTDEEIKAIPDNDVGKWKKLKAS